MMDGCAPDLAIVFAREAGPWAKAGLLARLDGDEQEGQLYVLPVLVHERMMAVRAQCMDAAHMAHLLDARMYPAWVPMQVLQALDELAMQGGAGMEIWPPQEGNTLFLEAFLQGVSGEWFPPEAWSVREMDAMALKNALTWLSDMAGAGLIDAAENREAALERFISGETAIFIDWSDAESKAYAKEIRDGEIVLVPYPNAAGIPQRAGRLVSVCAAEGPAGQEARRAAVLIASQARDSGLSGALDAQLGAVSIVGPIVLIISALLTAAYLLPVTINGFFPGSDFDYVSLEKKEAPKLATIPLLVLAVGVVLSGMLAQPLLEVIATAAAAIL